MENDKDIKRITVEYEDGTTQVVNKGFIADMKNNADEDEIEMTVTMCNISGSDIKNIVMGIIEFGAKMGMFNEEGEG